MRILKDLGEFSAPVPQPTWLERLRAWWNNTTTWKGGLLP